MTLQQAAVNLAVHGGDPTRLMPVNGPPGTGKTTLLRDLVAAVVVERAKAMATFDDPSKAFTASGKRFRSGNAFTHHYRIDPKLNGFEIVVASTNNKAVENVSAELPSERAISAECSGLRYFKSVADNVARGLVGDGAGSAASGTWGLFAAVLGNAKNRYAFRQTAWSDDEHGLRRYLLEASGNPQIIQLLDPNTGRILETRKPQVMREEKPPASAKAALEQWKSARLRFTDAMDAINERLAVLERGHRAIQSNNLLSEQEALAKRLVVQQSNSMKIAAGRIELEI